MVFVTGGTGLLGTHVLVELLKRGKSVRALRRSGSDLTSLERVFHHFFQEKATDFLSKVEWVTGDILDVPNLEEQMVGCTEVYHCAGFVSFKKRDFKKLMRVNKQGTANVVNVALSCGVKRFCHVSSTAAIGRSGAQQEYSEADKWTNGEANSNYAISKFSAETEVWRGKEEGLEVVIVNPSVILGVGDWNDSSLSIFKIVKKGLKFYTIGTNAFVDARDVAYAICELSDRNITNERFLVFSENRTFKSVFDTIATEFEVKKPSIEAKPWMAGLAWRIEGVLAFLFGKKQNITRETAKSAQMTTRYTNDKIKSAIGMEFIPIDQSVKDAVSFFKKQ